jgi:choline transport protein
VNASILCFVVVFLLGFVYLASSTAFEALVGCNVILADISFGFPIAILIFGGRKRLAPSTLSLGPVFGPFCNLISLGWIIFMVVMFELPSEMPVTAENMSKLASTSK